MQAPVETVQTLEYGEWRKLCFMEAQLIKALEILEDKLSEDDFKVIASEFFDLKGDLIRLQINL